MGLHCQRSRGCAARASERRTVHGQSCSGQQRSSSRKYFESSWERAAAMSLLAAVVVVLLLGEAAAAPHPWLAVSVNPKKMSALVSERFLGLTVDPMELSLHRKLGPGAVRTLAMARSLSPAYLRLAGPSSDTLHFTRGREEGPSANGTVTESDVRALAEWSLAAGWQLVVALNALVRTDGAWDGRSALDLLALADQQGYVLDWQLGYEAGSLQRAGVSGSQLGADLARARALLSEFPRYQGAKLLGPDVTTPLPRGGRDTAHYLLEEARLAAPAPDAVVWQPWPAGESQGIKDLDLDLVREDVNRLLGRAAARRPLWIAESEETAASRSFGGALQWAQRLQLAARVGADVILRRLSGLEDDHQPSPDFWVSLLHRRLCGRAVLDSRVAGNRTAASVTGMCTAAASAPRPASPLGNFARLSYERGDVTIIAVNNGPRPTNLGIKVGPAGPGPQHSIVHEYILTAPGNDLGSRSALLNGVVLSVDNGGVLPALSPRVRHLERDTSLPLPPHSIAFLVLPGAHARACQSAPLPAPATRDTVEVPLQLGPAGQDVQVKFHVDELPQQSSKSKVKEKLAAMQLKTKPMSHNSVLPLSADALPLSSAAPSSLEDYVDLFVPPAPSRARRAAPPHRLSAPEFFDKLARTQAEQLAKRNKHVPPAASADTNADNELTVIPVAASFQPEEREVEHHKTPHKLPLLKPHKLPKRLPLPVAPRHPHLPAHPKRPPLPHVKPIPKAVVASLVDPERNESDEDESNESAEEPSSFPTGAVLVEVGNSNEEASNNKEKDIGFDYVQDDEGESEVEANSHKDHWSHPGEMPEKLSEDTMKAFQQDQYYFAPGEFASIVRQDSGSRKSPAGGRDGELGELDLLSEPVNEAEVSTPAPFEPHLEEFVVLQAPQPSAEQERQARLRANQDIESFYQSAAEIAKEVQDEHAASQLPPVEEEVNTDLLIELGKKYLREKKMKLHETAVSEKGSRRPTSVQVESVALSSPTAQQQRIRRRRQVPRLMQASPRSAVTPRSRVRGSAASAFSSSALSDPPGLLTMQPKDITKELDERAQKRREERERISKELERNRKEWERERERDGRDRRFQERIRDRIDTPSRSRAMRTERVKRSDSSDRASLYLDSFGPRDALSYQVPDVRVSHHFHDGDLSRRGSSTGRYRYGHTPRRRQDVRHEVVKETNVVRYLPPEDDEDDDDDVQVAGAARRVADNAPFRGAARRVADSGEEKAYVDQGRRTNQWNYGNRLRPSRRQQQAYQPQDHVAAMWAGSPLSPYAGWPVEPSARPARTHQHQSPVVEASMSNEPYRPESTTIPSRPTEVKTTRILKTERTYEAGDGRGTTLKPALKNHHHHHHRSQEPSWSTQQSRVSQQRVGSSSRRKQRYPQSVSSSTAGLRTPAVLPADLPVLPELPERVRAAPRGDEYPVEHSGYPEPENRAPVVMPIDVLPEFPFREPVGPKNRVVGFTADDSSPGGWYTFSGSEPAVASSPSVAEPEESFPAPKESVEASEEEEEEEVPSSDDGFLGKGESVESYASLMDSPEVEEEPADVFAPPSWSVPAAVPAKVTSAARIRPVKPRTTPTRQSAVPAVTDWYEAAPATRQQQQSIQNPKSLGYLSRFFRPVPQPTVTPPVVVSAGTQQSQQPRAGPVAPPAPPARRQQLSASDDIKEQTSSDDFWNDDIWKQPVRDEVWAQPAGSDLWSSQPSRQPQSPVTRVGSMQRRPAQSSEKLLDYNTDILRSRPSAANERAAQNLQFASLAPTGSENENLRVVVDGPSAPARDQQPREQRAPPPRALPDPEWMRPSHPRYRRALRETADQRDANAASAKVMMETNRLDTAAEQEEQGNSMVEEVNGSKAIDNIESLLDSLASMSKVLGTSSASSASREGRAEGLPSSSDLDGNAASNVLDMLPWRLFVRGGASGAARTARAA